MQTSSVELPSENANASQLGNTSPGESDNLNEHNLNAFEHNTAVSPAGFSVDDTRRTVEVHVRKPSTAGLHIQTDLALATAPTTVPTIAHPLERGPSFIDTSTSLHLADHSPDDMASAASTASLSSVPSPLLSSLNDVTPLPSPIIPSHSPDLWRKTAGKSSSGSSASLARYEVSGLLPPASLPASPARGKKQYPGLGSVPSKTIEDNAANHARNRSISEYVPEALHNFRQRHTTMPIPSMSAAEGQHTPCPDPQLHREEHLSTPRSAMATDPSRTLPSPPPSNRSTADSEEGDELLLQNMPLHGTLAFRTGSDNQYKHWKPVRSLGKGTFSEVILATSDITVPARQSDLDPSSLVAIKIVAHDQAGGSDEERMEISVRREIEILRSLSHPCLPRLQAFDDNDTNALLVLNYCPGGDLFDLASQQRELLIPDLIQRIFTELVDAVWYLHRHMIVHRDIKLENILLNLPPSEIPHLPTPPFRHRHPIITLTDLGLSRHIPAPPDSPLLTHRCGSVDYAAPEILLGQPYDGRATDAWALGVVLYALMEGRLPFDAFPRGKRKVQCNSSVKHRIARCDWMWCQYGNEDGEWDGGMSNSKGKESITAKGLEGAKDCVEGLLKKAGRGRWELARVREQQWVVNGIQVESGLAIERR